ncbi:MAG: phosphoenolpyruvate--protein phosphotransferase [Alphaproteobacteria bacterium]|jgi:phosphotransferase system enzyme I (PtsI)|nr:phosphoenolpyruvate--protein phosphotransferase [Alphaproteobacteria bacterium]
MKSESKSKERQLVLDGVGVAPGIAIGPAHVVESGALNVPEYRVTKAEVADEKARFKAAIEGSRSQIERLKGKTKGMPPAVAEDLGYLLEAHLQMLTGSRLVRGVEERIADGRINAEAAVQAEISEIARGFAELPDAYMAARAQDVREVGARLIRNLTETPYQAFQRLPEGAVIVADEVTPADTALMDPKMIAGFATVMGGAEGHTGIMARSLELPAVLGVPDLTRSVSSGDMVIVDGLIGRVVVNPDAPMLRRYKERQNSLERERQRLGELRDLPAVTRDETHIELHANLELPREIELAVNAGAEGIGLLRTEFMFMNRETPPDENEQYESMRGLVEGMGGRPVTIRTLDVGGEKLAYSLGDHIADAVNPALGLRAIRLSLKQQRLLETQIAAILRAGAHGPVRILLPMISTVGEVRQVRDVVAKVVRRLKRRRARLAKQVPPIGVMIEVPGAALAADAIGRVADFFAIGTNDLTMYTLAIDRADEQVAHLFNPLHPAVLRLIQFSAEAAFRARIPISVCGEMAGDPRYTALLLGLGVRELSMAAANLPRVKQRVRQIDLMAATQRAQMIMDQADSRRIAVLLDDFNTFA